MTGHLGHAGQLQLQLQLLAAAYSGKRAKHNYSYSTSWELIIYDLVIRILKAENMVDNNG
jgi:hypothetical protein